MKEFVKLTATLAVITFLAAALLGATNALTKERIAAEAEAKQTRAMQALLPEAEEFIPLGTKDSKGM